MVCRCVTFHYSSLLIFQVVYKEPYMAAVLNKFCSEPYLQNMKTFLDTVSSANIIHSSFPVKLKDGYALSASPVEEAYSSTADFLFSRYLTKRAQGRKRFGRRNFKRRYFSLTTHELIYSKRRDGIPLCRIPVSEILAAEYVTEDSFNMKNMFQIIQPNRLLYIQASHCVEAKEWLDALNFVVNRNLRKRELYHPGVLSTGVWQCCKKMDCHAPGCTTVTSSHQIPFDIDVDRELEKVHSLFLENMDQLDKIHCKYLSWPWNNPR